MKIGVDLDGVVFDSETMFDVYAQIYDVDDLGRDSIKCPEEPRAQEKYNWTDEEENNYLLKYINMDDFDIMPGAKLVMDKLIDKGVEFIGITARGLTIGSEENIEVARKKLEENNINLKNIYWKTKDKLEICKKENIDIMIDDNWHNCLKASEGGIKTMYFYLPGQKILEENENLCQVNNWGYIYKKIVLKEF